MYGVYGGVSDRKMLFVLTILCVFCCFDDLQMSGECHEWLDMRKESQGARSMLAS
jgi:hypothetical protein